MNFARQDAQLLADANLRAVQEGRTDQSLQSQQRLAALQQQIQEKQLTGNLAEQMLASSYRPTQALLAQTQPSLNLADISTVAGRQLGGYGSELGRAMLDYDLGSEAAAANIRNQALQGIFGMLTGAQNQQQNNVSDWTGTGIGTLFEFLKDKEDQRIKNVLEGLFS
jgi:hypothetical protein